MAITKAELMKKIDEAIYSEDTAVSIYTKHIKTAVFWSGLNPEIREHIRIELGILEKESMRHKNLLEELKKKIEKDERNVF